MADDCPPFTLVDRDLPRFVGGPWGELFACRVVDMRSPVGGTGLIAQRNDDGRGSVRGMRDRWRAERSPSAKSELLMAKQ